MIYDYRAGFHKEPTNSVSTAVEMVKEIGAVEFFQKGTLTIDSTKLVAPVLEIVRNDKSIKKLLSDHSIHLRDKARKNALEHTTLYILDIIKQRVQEKSRKSILMTRSPGFSSTVPSISIIYLQI